MNLSFLSTWDLFLRPSFGDGLLWSSEISLLKKSVLVFFEEDKSILIAIFKAQELTSGFGLNHIRSFCLKHNRHN